MTDQEVYEQYRRSLSNQSPNAEQARSIVEVRAKAKRLLAVILDEAPASRERSLALTHLEETVMWAVKSIVLN